MSLPIRLAATAAPSASSSAYPLFRNLASHAALRQTCCASCSSPLRFRPRLFFSSTRSQPSSSASASAKRKLATSAAAVVSYPPTLDPSPPPPRNAGVSSVPKVNDVRPPPPPSPLAATAVAAEETASTTAATTTITATTTTATAKKARPKLRPRKAPITLTPNAVSRLRSLLDQPAPQLIRVGVRNKGCSGLAYHLEYVEKAGLLDEVVAQDGVSVLVESRALLSVIGSEMDWVSEKLGERFVFRNPNIKEQCGCGESFMI